MEISEAAYLLLRSTTTVVHAPQRNVLRFLMGQKHRSWRAFLLRFNMHLFLAQCEQVYLLMAVALF